MFGFGAGFFLPLSVPFIPEELRELLFKLSWISRTSLEWWNGLTLTEIGAWAGTVLNSVEEIAKERDG